MSESEVFFLEAVQVFVFVFNRRFSPPVSCLRGWAAGIQEVGQDSGPVSHKSVCTIGSYFIPLFELLSATDPRARI